MTSPPPTSRLDTTGFLDVVTCDAGTLRIEGWATTADNGEVDGIDVVWGGEVLRSLVVETGMPSPDVLAACPALVAAGSCRFRLTGPAPARASDVLVRVTPKVGGRPGRGFYRLLDPQLPQPPDSHVQAVGGSFLDVAIEMLSHFVERGGLQPDERVLDVGCGFGRIAYALAYYLNGAGRYDGFDVMRPLIDWASANIGKKRPNFRFRHVNVFNNLYNARGTLRAESFSFPYGDDAFDFVFLASVFTHLHGAEVRHYLNEIARVLRPGGRAVITVFLLTEESRGLIESGHASQALKHPCGDGFVTDPTVPEGAVGFEAEAVFGWVADRGLRTAAFYPGSWSGRSAGGLSYQDVLILEAGPKPASSAGGGWTGRLARWWTRA